MFTQKKLCKVSRRHCPVGDACKREACAIVVNKDESVLQNPEFGHCCTFERFCMVKAIDELGLKLWKDCCRSVN